MKILKGLICSIILIFVCGCSSQPSKESTDGVAAVVNDVEITRGEVEYYARSAMVPAADKQQSIEQKKSILANLVRSEILAQKAREMGLDKDPDFTLALYEARRQVLAGMAESRLVKSVKPLTHEAANSIVVNNPRFFLDRKLIVYDEILIQGVDIPFLNYLISMSDNGATEEQLIQEMTSKKKVFQKTTKSQTSEKIQPAILEVLLKSKPNHPIIARIEDKFSMIMMLHAVLPVPLQGDQATQAAISIAYSQQRNALLEKSIADLINSSKITYYGDYAKTSVVGKKSTDMPQANQKLAERKAYKSIGSGLILSLSFVLAMQVLTASMRILRGGLWLPKLWPSPNNSDEPQLPYEWDYEAYKIEKMYIGFVALIIITVLVLEIYLLTHYLPILGIIAGVLSGILLGIVVSRVFGFEMLKGLSHKVYTVLVALFTVPIVIGFLLIMKHPLI